VGVGVGAPTLNTIRSRFQCSVVYGVLPYGEADQGLVVKVEAVGRILLMLQGADNFFNFNFLIF
jgi:hypothetical protein